MRQDAEEGESRLRAMADDLRLKHPGASTKLEQGIERSLTVARLGLPPVPTSCIWVIGPVRTAFERAGKLANSAETPLARLSTGLSLIHSRRLMGHQELQQLARKLEERN